MDRSPEQAMTDLPMLTGLAHSPLSTETDRGVLISASHAGTLVLCVLYGAYSHVPTDLRCGWSSGCLTSVTFNQVARYRKLSEPFSGGFLPPHSFLSA